MEPAVGTKVVVVHGLNAVGTYSKVAVKAADRSLGVTALSTNYTKTVYEAMQSGFVVVKNVMDGMLPFLISIMLLQVPE